MPLAQINIGRLVAPVYDKKVAEFIENLERVNAIAERSEGFLWRLQSDEGNATAFKIENDPRFVPNMSVWRDIESFQFYVFNTLHKAFLKRRKEWFEPLGQPHFAMWFVDDGVFPTLDQGLERLEYLAQNGESERAFTWKSVRDGVYMV